MINQQVNRDRVQNAKQAACLGVNGSATDEAAAMQKRLIHFGRIASVSVIIRSGHHQDEVIAVETEAAGIWNALPTVAISGICDTTNG